jgi:hypothetical protein
MQYKSRLPARRSIAIAPAYSDAQRSAAAALLLCGQMEQQSPIEDADRRLFRG